MTARVSFVERLRGLGLTLAWLVAYTLIGTAGALVLIRISPVSAASPWHFTVNALSLALSFGFATWAVGVRFTKHSWDQLGWRGGGGGALARRLGRGAALGAAMAALAIGLALAWSGAKVLLTPEWSRWVVSAGPLAAGLLLAALWEELAFRGLPLRLLADAVGPMTAMLLLATGFGVAHAWNPHAGVFGTVNVALAAIWLSFAFFSAGGMPLAWGLHFGWNAGLALLFDAPVSGYTFHVPAVEYQPGARAWVDGGAFGPEGGLAATIVLCAGTLVVIGGRLRAPRARLA